MGKIAIVGVEGSGKTVLMAALTECYQKISDTEPYLMPENHSAFLFMQQVPHKLRVAREWPGATGIDSLRTMKWTLRCGTEIVQEIEMLDYPGELYRHAFGERKPAEVAAHRAELDEFLGHLTDAEMLVVLFNLADLEDLGTNARNVEAVWITKGIFDFAQKLPNLKRQLLVFTQADRYAATLKAHGGAQGLYAAKMPMLKVLHPDLPVTAIAAVDGTDDEGRPKADYSSAACHELMRLILHDADDLAKSYVKDCEQCAAALQNFTGGDVPAFQSECREYEAAFNNLSNAARPLSYAYRVALAAHKNKLSLYADLGEQANALVLSHHVTNSPHSGFYETLTNPETWAALRSRFLTCQSQLTAFHNYYADLHEKTRLSVIVQQRAQQKLRQEQERDARIIRYVIIGMVALFAILGVAFGYSMHKTYLRKLANALVDARQAKASAQWQTCLASVGEALALNPSHTEALALKREAETEQLAAEERERLAKIAAALAAARQAETEQLAAEERVRQAETEQLAAKERVRQAKVATALAAARQAQTAGEWQTCATRAGEALALDATHAEALALKRTAEGILAPKGSNPGEEMTVDLGGGVKLVLVWCPAGSFTMGSPDNEGSRRSRNDEIQHRVTVTKGFWIGKTEVTHAQWEQLSMDLDPSAFEGADQPVEQVSWDHCQKFVREVNARVPGGGFRLPTEAEWEYAARGGSKSRGFTYSGGNDLGTVGWFTDNSGGKTHPVGKKAANELGLYDMSGNVREWCQDWYGAYPAGSATDGTGPDSGSSRVCRGGGWGDGAGSCRSAARYMGDPNFLFFSLGLRLARTPH